MSHIAMAMNTGKSLPLSVIDQELMHEILMAVHTRMLCNASISRLDLNWLVKVVQRESDRVEETVVSFGHILSHKIVREMAVIADSEMAMTRLLPAVEM